MEGPLNVLSQFTDVACSIDADLKVATIELRRPPNNFFDRELVHAVAEYVAELESEPDCRAIVLAAEGKHFCAGRDFSRPARADDGPEELYREGLRLFDGTKPIIAAVNGSAVGGGLGLAMAADFRVAGPSTRFAANFTRIGYFPGFGLTATLPRVVGEQRALEILYTGRDLIGSELAGLGLCDRYAEDDDVRTAALALAGEIAEAAPLSVSAVRAVLRGGMRELVADATAVELEHQLRLRQSKDFAEAQNARREKRAVRFSGS